MVRLLIASLLNYTSQAYHCVSSLVRPPPCNLNNQIGLIDHNFLFHWSYWILQDWLILFQVLRPNCSPLAAVASGHPWDTCMGAEPSLASSGDSLAS